MLYIIIFAIINIISIIIIINIQLLVVYLNVHLFIARWLFHYVALYTLLYI